MIQNLLLIFLGGGIGSLLRYGVSYTVRQFPESTFPVATLCSNILSCTIMGIALGFFAGKINDNTLRLFIIAGICGGFSTFSTFSMETLELMRKGNYVFAFANVALSLTLCLIVLAALTKKYA